MRILVAAVGRARGGVECQLYEHYARRLSWPLRLKELAQHSAMAPAEAKAKEGEALLAAIPAGAKLAALDGRGELLTSEGFAAQLAAWRDGGVSELAFAIGGAHGLADAVLARADLVLSLGRVTWPHLLVRGLLAEQLYRAETILAGHPYHRG